jgi:tRNA-guanine family transglycosylase
LASIHNIYFIVNIVKGMRESMIDDTFYEYRDEFMKEWDKKNDPNL